MLDLISIYFLMKKTMTNFNAIVWYFESFDGTESAVYAI